MTQMNVLDLGNGSDNLLSEYFSLLLIFAFSLVNRHKLSELAGFLENFPSDWHLRVENKLQRAFFTWKVDVWKLICLLLKSPPERPSFSKLQTQ